MKKPGYLLLAVVLFLCYGRPLHAQTFSRPQNPAPVLTGFGGAVAVAGDEVFIGEPLNRYRPGIVYVYSKDGDAWTEQAQLTAPEGSNGDYFGQALAVTENTLLVGAASQDSTQGEVFVFQRDDAGAAWSAAGRLTASDGTPNDGFGTAITLGDGVALVGAPGRNEGTGAVYVFRYDEAAGTWSEEATLVGSASQAETNFGAALAVEEGLLLVGAPGQNNETGAAYAFRYDEGADAWAETALLSGGTADEGSRFGTAVHLREGTALVGAPRQGSTGAVFTFRRGTTSANWEETGRLLPFDGAQRYLFGTALAAAGDEVWVGAPGASDFAGQVYLFQQDEGGWARASKLAAGGELQGRTLFSGTLAVEEGVAVVGATGDDHGAGSAVIFERDPETGTWEQQTILRSPPDGLEAVVGERVRCEGGEARLFACSQVDLLSFMPIEDLGGGRGIRLNDVWGWEDPETGKEYALVGRIDGTAFVDISDPQNPVYIGELPRTEGAPASTWRDIKVYEDHAFIVADNAGEHGMQVFDLTKLRQHDGEPITFEQDALYDRVHSVHNIVINKETGYAYAVGSSGGGQTCGGGLHMINIQDPTNPQFAGCFADPSTGRSGTGYTHDAQCIVYEGPDTEHQGQEICFGSNETALSIADVTDKDNPEALAVAEYPNVGYTHQGWITDDHRYFYVNDELDELSGLVDQTRTLIWDITDLDDPQMVKAYTFGPNSSDHNLYVVGDYMYQSNYASGLRIHDISNPENPSEIGYFDTSPAGDNGPGFTGTWSNYPFFDSGVIVVSSIGEGLFLLRRQNVSL